LFVYGPSCDTTSPPVGRVSLPIDDRRNDVPPLLTPIFFFIDSSQRQRFTGVDVCQRLVIANGSNPRMTGAFSVVHSPIPQRFVFDMAAFGPYPGGGARTTMTKEMSSACPPGERLIPSRGYPVVCRHDLAGYILYDKSLCRPDYLGRFPWQSEK